MKFIKQKKAFTLIELLVVIAIIGILAGILILSMVSATNSANDAKRKADINQIVNSLLVYNASNSSYPASSTCNIGSNCPSEVNSALGNSINARDPQGTYYTYSSDGTNFTVSVVLSDANTYTYGSSSSSYSSGGACGSSAGEEHDSTPSANLCLSGLASSVIFDGVAVYSWTCGSASCSATKTGWIDTGLGFYIMKYEAKNVGSVATSVTAGTPWVSISQTAAATACSSLGSGYHLITNAEWTALARNIESASSNWSGGSIGSGFMPRGYSASTVNGSDPFSDSSPAPNTGIGYEYNTGANAVGPSGSFIFKRILNLSNGKVIWDLAGNVWEWNNNTCTQGSGTGNWHADSFGWLEWNDSNLSDYELGVSGPNPLYTSSQNLGRYIGCVAGGALYRGGGANYGTYAGLFAAILNGPPSATYGSVGFRCVK